MRNTKGYTLIEVCVTVVIAAIVFAIVFGAYKGGFGALGDEGTINPYWRPREAQAQALQRQNELKERELELMEENNRLLRELKNK
jgi:prepilin-type N-terminal cleavage/methylation domain-containing protein